MASPSQNPSSPPPPPEPSSDAGMRQAAEAARQDDGSGLEKVLTATEINVFELSPVVALKLMCSSLDALVKITGDVPPTPPISQPHTPILDQVKGAGEGSDGPRQRQGVRGHKPRPSSLVVTPDDIEAVRKQRTPVGSPEAHDSEPIPAVDARPAPMSLQHGAITRKFYSKKPPPISLQDYVLRMHRYCPMSTAVYLATSLYIHRLAVVDKVLPVTGRNIHRLLLGGLRVAMKALEDLNYPHARFAAVGGVSEPELARLEISFCFVSNFDLKVKVEALQEHAFSLKETALAPSVPRFEPKLPPLRDKRRATPTQGTPLRS
ncbi:MAG: hypothetical protein M4579_003901 [Chaenotheca gracillima]|nr:MAG: hypothetical protein M4579_003901 [Chaenotheca gracillima]